MPSKSRKSTVSKNQNKSKSNSKSDSKSETLSPGDQAPVPYLGYEKPVTRSHRLSIPSSPEFIEENPPKKTKAKTPSNKKNKDPHYLVEVINPSKPEQNKKIRLSIAANRVSDLKKSVKKKLLDNKVIEHRADQIELLDQNNFLYDNFEEVETAFKDRDQRELFVVVKKKQQAQDKTASKTKDKSESKVKIQIEKTLENPILIKVELQPYLQTKIKEQTLILSVIFPQKNFKKVMVKIDYPTCFFDVSLSLVKQLDLDQSYKTLLYSPEGHPLLFNLDFFLFNFPKISEQKEYYGIITRTQSLADKWPDQIPIAKLNEPQSIGVQINKQVINLQIDLQNNTVAQLKYLLFAKTGLVPQCQKLYHRTHQKSYTTFLANYGEGQLLIDSKKKLSSYNIISQDLLYLSVEGKSNTLPKTVEERYNYQDIKHYSQQNEQSLRFLRSHLLVLTRHLPTQDTKKFIAFVRQYTNNPTLALSLHLLFRQYFLNQASRIALQQGLLLALDKFLEECPTKLIHPETNSTFNFFRNFIRFVLRQIETITRNQDLTKIEKQQSGILISKNCYFSQHTIWKPILIHLKGNTVIGEYEQMLQQVKQKKQIEKDREVRQEDLVFPNEQFMDFYEIYKLNLIDHQNILSYYCKLYQLPFNFPKTKQALVIQQVNVSIHQNDNLKIHKPLELKSKSTNYLLLEDKKHKLWVYLQRGKSINASHLIYDVVSAEQKYVNLDEMASNLQKNTKTSDSHQPVITRMPQEAIVVLLDVSKSMGSQFAPFSNLTRLNIVKRLFQGFANRTMAYNFEHVVSLVLFNDDIRVITNFTQAFQDFNDLIQKVQQSGTTYLYDSIVYASKMLEDLGKKYPLCRLRILALTDGNDTGSTSSYIDALRSIVKSSIVIDSFVVDDHLEDIKNITQASGGKCFLCQNLIRSLKLFEEETILSVRCRQGSQQPIENSMDMMERLDLAKALDYSSQDVYQFKLPQQINSAAISVENLLKMIEQKQKQVTKLSSSIRLRRIAQEVKEYTSNPHPYFRIYPSMSLNLWKILFLGPELTSYRGGRYLLYLQFPEQYPNKAPQVRFLTQIYHCNINHQGRICHSVFDRNYNPGISIRTIIDCIYGIILTPQPEDPLDSIKASQYMDNRFNYDYKVIQWNKKYAQLDYEDIIQYLIGNVKNLDQRDQKATQIVDWIMNTEEIIKLQ